MSGVSRAFRQVWDALAALRARVDAKPTQTQGRVTSVNPVRVQLDSDSSPSPLTPRVLNGDVQVGDRVTVLHTKHDLTVIGVVGKTVDLVPAGRRAAVRSQTIPQDTVTRLEIFGSSGDDITGDISTVGTYGLQVNVPGWYSVSAGLRWQDSSTATQLRIVAGGSTVAFDMTRPADSGGTTNMATTHVRLNAGTVIFCNVYTTTARSTNTTSSFMDSCFLSAVLIARG